MVGAVVLGGGFDCHYVVYVFDDADGCMVAGGVGADFADIVFGNVVADMAELDVLLHALNGFGEVGDVVE